MVHLQMQGLMGNNLFQYSVARILAEDLGYAMEVSHSPYKPSLNVPQLIALMSRFQDAPLSLPGKSFDRPIDKTAVIGHNNFDGYQLDLEAIRQDKSNRMIKIDGYFERYEILRSHKERIRQWFRIDPIDLGHEISDGDAVVHIRRGDFILFGRALSLDFYTKILDEMDFDRLFVCGFGLDREVKEAFKRFDPIYVSGDPIDDFRFIKGFNRIIQSQSTFAWWAGFLSDAEEIYAPVTIPNSSAFERQYPFINLEVDDESRYHYVRNVPCLDRQFTLADMVSANKLLPFANKRFFAHRWIDDRLYDSDIGCKIFWLLEVKNWYRYRRKQYRRGLYRFDGVDKRLLGQYRKIIIIRMNHSNAGFFACFTFALNQILFCERNRCLPVVYFGKDSNDGDNAYYDASVGDNVWEYYFEPVADYSYSDIQQWIGDPNNAVESEDVMSLTDHDLWYLHLFEKNSVYAYAYGRNLFRSRFDARWADGQRRRAHDVIQRRIRIKPQIQSRFEAFYQRHMAGRNVLGLHMRGTDKGSARATAKARRKLGPDVYRPYVDSYLEKYPDSSLFVATDQVQYLERMKQFYGDKVLATDSVRSTDKLAPFQKPVGSGYAKGSEVLVDVLLLSRCNFLLKCASHTGEAALWFNPDLPSLDLNYAPQDKGSFAKLLP